MIIQTKQRKLAETIQDFYNATGVNITVVDSTFAPLAKIGHGHIPYCLHIQSSPQGKAGCFQSDKSLFEKCSRSRKVEMQICHCGLLDLALPVIHNDSIIAYVIMGQIKVSDEFPDIGKYMECLDLSPEKTRQLYESMPVFDETRIQAVANIAVILIKYMLLENMLTARITENLGIADHFISENIQRELTIRDIEKGTNLSKSALYKDFNTCFHCTVKEYIHNKRIEKAAQLILSTELSMEEISVLVGYNSAAYFSKQFKRIKGVSPLKFRKGQSY